MLCSQSIPADQEMFRELHLLREMQKSLFCLPAAHQRITLQSFCLLNKLSEPIWLPFCPVGTLLGLQLGRGSSQPPHSPRKEKRGFLFRAILCCAMLGCRDAFLWEVEWGWVWGQFWLHFTSTMKSAHWLRVVSEQGASCLALATGCVAHSQVPEIVPERKRLGLVVWALPPCYRDQPGHAEGQQVLLQLEEHHATSCMGQKGQGSGCSWQLWWGSCTGSHSSHSVSWLGNGKEIHQAFTW